MDDPEFTGLLMRVRAGDEQAARQLLEAFEGELRLMVRVRLPNALRNQYDSMDFVQAAWASVLVGPGACDAHFEGPRQFLRYLSGVVQNKVWEEYRRRTRTKKYELAREERLYVRKGDHEEVREVVAPGPTPSQELQARDRLGQLLAGRSPAEIEVLELRRQGLTFQEIADRTGWHERTVRRLIDALRTRMEARRWD